MNPCAFKKRIRVLWRERCSYAARVKKEHKRRTYLKKLMKMRGEKQVRALVDRDDRFQVIYLGIIWVKRIKNAENNIV